MRKRSHAGERGKDEVRAICAAARRRIAAQKRQLRITLRRGETYARVSATRYAANAMRKIVAAPACLSARTPREACDAGAAIGIMLRAARYAMPPVRVMARCCAAAYGTRRECSARRQRQAEAIDYLLPPEHFPSFFVCRLPIAADGYRLTPTSPVRRYYGSAAASAGHDADCTPAALPMR